jgi:hypothetical protein
MARGAAAPIPEPADAALTTTAAKPSAAAARFAVEFGPYVTTDDAERVERQLAQAGLPSARFRQRTGGGLSGVLLEQMPAGRDAGALVVTLREQGFGEASVVRQDPPAVRLGEPLPLRGAVELAERARALGYQVRVAAQPGEAVAYTIRHGNFGSRLEAEAKARELGRLGLSRQVIQVR